MQGSGGAVCTHARCAAQVVGGLTLPGVGSGGGAAVPADVALQAVPGRPVQWTTHPASLRGSAGWCWGSLRACAVRRAGGRGPDAAGGSAAAAPAGDPAVAMLPAMPGRPVQWPTHPASLRGSGGAVCARARCAAQAVGGLRLPGVGCCRMGIACRCGAASYAWAASTLPHPTQTHSGEGQGGVGTVCARAQCCTGGRGKRRCHGVAAVVVQGCLRCGAVSCAWAASALPHPSQPH